MTGIDFFEKVYCINLDSRIDRWDKAQKEFEKIGIKDLVQRISGHVPNDNLLNKGERGCMISHIECLKDAKKNNYKNILIFEDDVIFTNQFVEKLKLSISELPLDWDLFYLGFCPKDVNSKFDIHSKNLFRLKNDCYCTHSIAYNKKAIDYLFNNFDVFIKESAYDIMLSKYIHPELKCFATNPPIAHQQLKSFSDISSNRNGYDWSLMIYNQIANINGFEKVNDTCKNLVFTSCGDRNLFFDRWIKDYRNYDLAVVHYGNKKELFDLYKSVSVFCESRKASKFQNFSYFYKYYNGIFSNYDYIFILDDDIKISSEDINKMFDIAKEKNLSICQPSFSKNSKISHNITKNISDVRLTYTNFVEVNCPLFNKQSIVNLMDVYDDSLIGWGVDYLYIQANGLENKKSYAIIHDVVCENLDTSEESRELSKVYGYTNREKLWKRYCYLNNRLTEFEHIVYDTEYS